ncbi:hypothetical protein TVAG_261110 [Trichomonas vaginalis G3]|uniref:Transmembrane protein n=1 Tax=Trichomonas vaginalis (strain ATCC PRA-98 / G3) TaxID=412133 RepID=A2FPS1_TRIV3|nr:hypothetical protein TVAGG3_0494530 [Trichomonas vaginalis G3]EAX93101.1 hypothetical protein TVAG_261110 [Trichomonas vaginalis G3]KAI5516618.1 hypothetical protein TVAGG3_0494530 [Trichomonas vaginalis G3]|eukprot:XP_001306031.1 hypothetical protein [Trichomonas vaginalis G3]
MNNTIILNAIDNIKEYFLDMNVKKVYLLLFDTLHFPVPFILQSIFASAIVRKSKLSISMWYNLFISFLLIFTGRCTIALLYHRDFPLIAKPYYVPTFLAIWGIVNFSTHDIVYRIAKTRFFSLIGRFIIGWIQVRECIHGVNMGSKNADQKYSKIIFSAIILSSSEIIIYAFANLKAREYNPRVLFRLILISIIYYVGIYEKERITTYTDAYFQFPDMEIYKLILLGYHLLMYLLDSLIFGINDSITYLVKHVEKPSE